MSDHAFETAAREAVYQAIYTRRDIRHYRPDPVPPALLRRVLDAAHHAPSVGFMQPWNFLVVQSRPVREAVHAHFLDVNHAAAEVWRDDRKRLYQGLKLQGLLDAPLSVAVTCDPTRGGRQVLGRHTMRETDVYSTCLAVQNLWLAARAEGLGVGWMSIMQPEVVKRLVGIPDHVVLVAWLTVGWPVEVPDEPMLQSVGWRRREPLDPLVFLDRWGATYDGLPEPAAPASEPDRAAPTAAVDRLAALTRPPGSLGFLDQVALRMCGLQGRPDPSVRHKHLLLLAGDHGVTAEGVSAYRPEVTAKMVLQFVAGAAAVNAFARQHGVEVHVADLGVDHDFLGATGVIDHKVRRGTRNLTEQPAMTEGELAASLAAGASLVDGLEACDLLAVGEMGIGNTTAAAALACALLDEPPEELVGIGTGVGERTRARKREVVRRALDRHATTDPLQALRCLGGYEIAGLVGVLQAAARRRVMVVLDGLMTGVAALVAVRLDPDVRHHLVAGHVSAEPAHRRLLDELGLRPLLDLDMRLGEGSGAVLAVGLIVSAGRTPTEMRTFEEAGIEHPLAPGGRD